MICCYITAVPGNALVTSTDTSHIVENYSALLQLRAGFPKKFWVIKSPALSYCTKHNNLQKCRIAWFKSKQITGLRPYFMFLWYYNYSWSGISFVISHVDIKKTSQELRCFWETSTYTCIMSAPGLSSVKFKTSKDPQKTQRHQGYCLQQVQSLLLRALEESEAER